MAGSTTLHELYDASYGRLVLQVFALCGTLAEAEDAVQEAFVKAIGQGRAFDKVRNPEAWLRTVALNHQRNKWRHAKVIRGATHNDLGNEHAYLMMVRGFLAKNRMH